MISFHEFWMRESSLPKIDWTKINGRLFPGHEPREVLALEKVSKRLCKTECSLLFNSVCVDEILLPNYSNINRILNELTLLMFVVLLLWMLCIGCGVDSLCSNRCNIYTWKFYQQTHRFIFFTDNLADKKMHDENLRIEVSPTISEIFKQSFSTIYQQRNITEGGPRNDAFRPISAALTNWGNSSHVPHGTT